MNLRTAIGLQAGEEMVEREGGAKIPELRQSAKKAKVKAFGQTIGQRESGWQYGFRHPVGFIPQRNLAGFPSVGRGRGHGAGAPVVPKAPKPKMPRVPNPSHSTGAAKRGFGHYSTSPSIRRLSNASEGAEPPETGAYSAKKTPKSKFFRDPAIKGRGAGPGLKDVGIRTPKHEDGNWEEISKVVVNRDKTDAKEKALNDGYVPKLKKKLSDTTFRKRKKRALTHDHLARHKVDAELGEPAGVNTQHMHLDVKPTFQPPSLVKRNKQTRVPTDDVGETNDKYLDVTKRNSKGTWGQRMKLLKRSAPGGSPAQIPARTTLIPEHSGVWLPTSMMSAEKVTLKQRPVNWDKQPKQRTSYERRGCI